VVLSSSLLGLHFERFFVESLWARLKIKKRSKMDSMFVQVII
jgi:hypothetical protein